MSNYEYEHTVCQRCKRPISIIITDVPRSQAVFIAGYGTVCVPCAEVLTGDDDYNDPYTGEKIL